MQRTSENGCELSRRNDFEMEVSRAHALLNDVVRGAYSELPDGTKLCALTRWTQFFFSSPFSGRIYARRELVEAMPCQVLRGLLAHELAHKVQFKGGWKSKLLLCTRWIISRKSRRCIERDADEED